MDKKTIAKAAGEFVNKSDFNYVSRDKAITENLGGLKIFDEPIFAFGAAEDIGFKLLKNPSIVGEHLLTPREWLQGANTVISYFFPFTDEVRKSNRENMRFPSNEWLHGRIEGQNFLNEFGKFLSSELNAAGYESVVPSLDSRFELRTFSSNWSERHAAFVCGLGTFGLSKGLITERGMAGRFGSIITRLRLEPDIKKYKDIYAYCTMCGACAKNCPVGAIAADTGKDHRKCSDFLDITREKYKPRYGCGKCQVSVPCEKGIPASLK